MGFSVLMSVYEKETLGNLELCLRSLANQSLLADEVVLVEDGPLSEEILSLIDSFRAELNVISVRLAKNSGLAIALNEGLRYCSNELVARMDTDDICLADRFEKQIGRFAQNTNLDILGCFGQEIDENNRLGLIRIMPVTHERIRSNLFSCPFIHPSVMYKKSSILSVGGYDDKLKRRQDYDLWFRCAQVNMKFENVAEVLIQYRFTVDTHARQSKKVLWDQALIGFKGVRSLKQPLWKAIGAFYPLIRSTVPAKVETCFYKVFKRFDPRERTGEL